MANKRKVFISYDYENDKHYKNLLLAWDQNKQFDFYISDYSADVSINSTKAGTVKSVLSRYINSATVLLVILGEKTHKSNWSKANRERAENMLALGRMTPIGQKLSDLAKATGTWEALIDVQNSVIPADLQLQLNHNQLALKNFQAFSPSSKRIILEWILNAKKNVTRQKRIDETVRLAAENIKANHYRQ